MGEPVLKACSRVSFSKLLEGMQQKEGRKPSVLSLPKRWGGGQGTAVEPATPRMSPGCLEFTIPRFHTTFGRIWGLNFLEPEQLGS